MEAKITGRGITFDDVLIRPSESAIEPSEAKLNTEIARGFFVSKPILSAAMDRVTGAEMAIAIAKMGGVGILHRNCTKEEQVQMVTEVKEKNVFVGAACGPFDEKRAKVLDDAKCDLMVIDCAHGHNKHVIESAKKIHSSLKHAKLIVGNIATREAARALSEFADGIKVGVGPGSICTTRIVSGVGVPQLSAILEVVEVARKRGVPVIADGGMRTSGDVAKALAAGASAVMLGNILSGTDEAPGNTIKKDGRLFKEYRGMGSAAALKNGNGLDRYLSKNGATVAEGVEGFVPCKGSVKNVFSQIISGVQIAMGYVGAKTLEEFYERARFIGVSHASATESAPHSVHFPV